MKRVTICCLLFGLCGSVSSSPLSQDNHRPKVRTPTDTSVVLTGDMLDGVKYYIKIVPHDTTLDEKMPMYKPDETKIIELDRQPTPIKKVQPAYPDEARRAKIEGNVWVLCLIGKDGKVQETKLQRADNDVLAKAAIAAAKQWVFLPGKLRGKPIAVWVGIPFHFKLDE